MADYPEWVLKFKRKGTYINYQNGKYYLYAAHSERIPGTDKVRRVSDGYIGRITETEGLIPAKRKMNDPIYTYEYGLSDTILSLCENIWKGLVKEYRNQTNYVMIAGTILFMYGEIRNEYYESSWLSVRIPALDMRKIPTEGQLVGIERVQRMITDTLERHFKEAFSDAVSLLPLVRVVRMSNETKIAEISEGVKEFLDEHKMSFKEVRYG